MCRCGGHSPQLKLIIVTIVGWHYMAPAIAILLDILLATETHRNANERYHSLHGAANTLMNAII